VPFSAEKKRLKNNHGTEKIAIVQVSIVSAADVSVYRIVIATGVAAMYIIPKHSCLVYTNRPLSSYLPI